MATGVIPPEFIATWSKMKKKAPEVIKNVARKGEGKGVVSKEDADKVAKETVKLFATFDQGLKKALEAANKASGGPAQKAALAKVNTILNDYQTKAAAWASKDDNGLRKSVAEMVTKNLEKLTEVVSTTMKNVK